MPKPKDIKALNDISRARNPKTRLGDLLGSAGSIPYGKPSNGFPASITLTIPTEGETYPFNGHTVTVIDTVSGLNETYEFVYDEDQEVSSPENVPVPLYMLIGGAAAASADFAFPAGNPDIGYKVSFGKLPYEVTEYTIVASAASPGDVEQKTTEIDTLNALVAAINGEDAINTANPFVLAQTAGAELNSRSIKARTRGADGNDLVMGGATVSGGKDCTKFEAFSQLGTAIYDNTNQAIEVLAGQKEFIIRAFDIGDRSYAISVNTTIPDVVFTHPFPPIPDFIQTRPQPLLGEFGPEKPESYDNPSHFRYDDGYIYFFVDPSEEAIDPGGYWVQVSCDKVEIIK